MLRVPPRSWCSSWSWPPETTSLSSQAYQPSTAVFNGFDQVMTGRDCSGIHAEFKAIPNSPREEEWQSEKLMLCELEKTEIVYNAFANPIKSEPSVKTLLHELLEFRTPVE
eukprot:2171879-Amphidinium_carterae.1